MSISRVSVAAKKTLGVLIARSRKSGGFMFDVYTRLFNIGFYHIIWKCGISNIYTVRIRILTQCSLGLSVNVLQNFPIILYCIILNHIII